MTFAKTDVICIQLLCATSEGLLVLEYLFGD